MFKTDEYVIVANKLRPVYTSFIDGSKFYLDDKGYTRLVTDKVLDKNEAMDKYPEEFI